MKNTKLVHWKTEGGEFQTKHQSKVEIVLPELNVTKSMTRNFRVDDLEGNRKHNMRIERDILPKLKI